MSTNSDHGEAHAEPLNNRNCLTVGSPGSGKTTGEIKYLVEEADRGDAAIVILDPHKHSLASGAFAHFCERGHRDRIIFDRLPDIQRVPMWDFLPPSRAKSARERQGENQTRCEQFTEIMLRRRGKESAANTPNIEEWLLAALHLILYQAVRRPLADLRFAFRFSHRKCQELLDGCTDADTRAKFDELIGSRLTPYKAAERVIAAVFRSAAFQVRSEHCGGFKFEELLQRKAIIILEGGEGGTLSADAMRVMLGAVAQKTINWVRERNGEYPPVTLSMDEANNCALVGAAGHETRAMAELRKKGLGVRVIVQHFDFPTTRIERAVLATCATHTYYNISDPRTADRAGEDLGGTYETPGTKTRYYKDGSSWDAPARIVNPYALELRELKRGRCITRRGTRVVREYISPLSKPFALPAQSLSRVVDGLVKVVQQRPEYYSPTNDQSPPTTQSPDPLTDPPETDGGPFAI